MSSSTSSRGLLGVLARVGERLLGWCLVALLLEPRIGLGEATGAAARPGRLGRLDVERLVARSPASAGSTGLGDLG